MAEPFTDADVELVGRVLAVGRWDMTAPLDRQVFRIGARQILGHLALAGRLLPPGVVLIEQRGHLTSTGDVQRCLGGVCGTVPDRRRWVTDGTWEALDGE
jgi:hypothetical protein